MQTDAATRQISRPYAAAFCQELLVAATLNGSDNFKFRKNTDGNFFSRSTLGIRL